jgi:hypothetical protein
MGKGLQRLLADALLGRAQIGQDLGRVTGNAQRGAKYEEGQNQEKPPGAVDGVQAQRGEQRGPEGTELVDVIGRRLVLLEDGANDRGDADDGKQRDRKAHRRQQLQCRAKGLSARIGGGTVGDHRHDIGSMRGLRPPGR